jgi:hypothetical protein
MKEIWKDIPNYDGKYQVSNIGRVRSFQVTKHGRIMSNSANVYGYPRVTIEKNKFKKTINIHKLMQIVFNLGDGLIDHINGDKLDNRLENLRVVTNRGNLQNLKCHREGKLVGAKLDKRKIGKPRPWESRIRINDKYKHLGIFATELEAHQAYLKAVRENDE